MVSVASKTGRKAVGCDVPVVTSASTTSVRRSLAVLAARRGTPSSQHSDHLPESETDSRISTALVMNSLLDQSPVTGTPSGARRSQMPSTSSASRGLEKFRRR